MLAKLLLLAFLSLFSLSFSLSERPLAEPSKIYRLYKGKVIQSDGRVIDWQNKAITHSEGVGYSLFFTVVFNDKQTFYRIFRWMENNLGFNEKGLIPWSWGERKGRWGILDKNDATDGNLWITFSLLLAYEKWGDNRLKDLAYRLMENIKRYNVFSKNGCVLLTGGSQGFIKDKLVITNPSYYFPPIFMEFYRYNRDPIWLRLVDSSVRIFKEFVVTDLMLYPEWVQVDGVTCKPLSFDGVMGFNAVRIPIWIALSQNTVQKKNAGSLLEHMRFLAKLLLKDSRSLCSRVMMNYESCKSFLSAAFLPFNSSLANNIDAKALNRNYYFLSLLIFAILEKDINNF